MYNTPFMENSQSKPPRCQNFAAAYLPFPQVLEVIMVGDAVVAETDFHNMQDKSKPGVEKGMRGIVKSVNYCGNYCVRWEPLSKTRPHFTHDASRSKKQIRRLSDQEVQCIYISRGSHNVCLHV